MNPALSLRERAPLYDFAARLVAAEVDAVLNGKLDLPGRPTPVVDPARGIVHRA